MDDITFHRLRHLFDEIVWLAPDQRVAAIAGRNDLDERTRRRLLDLLDIDAEVADLTARNAIPSANSVGILRPGTRIGAYVIDSPLGEGGMGSVYRARRDGRDIEQWVAIKVARRELLDESTLARFRVERQVLALLQHPQIAAMHDVGELADGTPYIVMEYVQGRPLLEDADARELGLRERLEIFLLLCDAVAYAHRNLIVHRDIKSSNVLVTADGRPKLLDFGIAKPLNPRLGAVAIEHTLASQRFFSPRNVAPEQLRGDAIDVTCDVYGLGSVLYELLCGRPLYDFDGMTFTQIERCITEDDPQAPSRRVLPGNDSPSWRHKLPRDLDAIALRALRRTPHERYPSVESLADDVRRYMKGYPVAASKSSWLYRSRRFLRRHRVVVATAALLTMGAAAGITSWLQQYQSALDERDRATAMTQTILRALDMTMATRLRGEEPTMRELFRNARNLIVNQHRDTPPGVQVHLDTTMGGIYTVLGDPNLLGTLLERVLEKELPQVPAALRNETEATYAEALFASERYDEAEAVFRKHSPKAGSSAARLRWQLLDARMRIKRGKFASGLALFEEIVAPEALIPPEPRKPGGGIFYSIPKKTHYSRLENVAIFTALQDAQHAATEASSYDVSARLSDFAFQACLRAFMSRLYYTCLIAANHHAIALARARQFDKAEEFARLAITQIELNGNFSEIGLLAELHFTQGEILRRQESSKAAEEYRTAIRIAGQHFGGFDADVIRYRTALFVALLQQGDIFGANQERYAVSYANRNDRRSDTNEANLIGLGTTLLHLRKWDDVTLNELGGEIEWLAPQYRLEPTTRELYQAVADIARREAPDTPSWWRPIVWLNTLSDAAKAPPSITAPWR